MVSILWERLRYSKRLLSHHWLLGARASINVWSFSVNHIPFLIDLRYFHFSPDHWVRISLCLLHLSIMTAFRIQDMVALGVGCWRLTHWSLSWLFTSLSRYIGVVLAVYLRCCFEMVRYIPVCTLFSIRLRTTSGSIYFGWGATFKGVIDPKINW